MNKSLLARLHHVTRGALVNHVKTMLAGILFDWVQAKPGHRVILDHSPDGIEVTFLEDGQRVDNTKNTNPYWRPNPCECHTSQVP